MNRRKLIRKIFFSILVACLMILGLVGCGGKKEEIKKELDPEKPIPEYTGKLSLQASTFEDINLILNLPDSVTADLEDGKAVVTDKDGKWEIYFKPYTDTLTTKTNIEANWFSGENSKKIDWSQDVAGTLAGFPIHAWANNTFGPINLSNETDAPGVDIMVDFGDTFVGPYYGMHIRLSSLSDEEGTNIYEFLHLEEVLAVLNNFEVIETPDGVIIDRGYITVTAPTRWNVHEDSMILTYQSGDASYTISMSPNVVADPSEAANKAVGEDKTASYELGDRTYYGGMAEKENPQFYLLTEFSDTHSLQIVITISDGNEEAYQAYLENDTFLSVLASMVLTPENYNTHGGQSVNGINTALGVISAYDGKDTEIVIPEKIGDYDTYSIAAAAFSGNTTITRLELPEGVTELEEGCFANMTALETIILPSTLTVIPDLCFRGCTNLKDVILGDQITQVGSMAFYEAGTGSFTGSANIIYGNDALAYSGFDTVTIGENSDASAENLLYYSAASEVILSSGITALGANALGGMDHLTEIVLPDTITSLGDRCFAGTELTRINIPLSLESVGEEICLSESLITVDIPDGLTKIPAGIFGSARIGYVNIPASVTEIGKDAIKAEYTVLNQMDVTIEQYGIETTALYLNGIYSTDQVPADLANIYVWRQIFLPMDATTTESDALDAYLLENEMEEIAWIGIAPEFYDLDTQDYIADEEEPKKLKTYIGDKTSVMIPYVNASSSPIRQLASGAFAETTGITELSLGQVQIIEDHAFEGLNDLKDLWLNGTMAYYAGRDGNLSDNSFTDLPETLTVHYPESMSEEELDTLKTAYENAGMPQGVTYESYSLRTE